MKPRSSLIVLIALLSLAGAGCAGASAPALNGNENGTSAPASSPVRPSASEPQTVNITSPDEVVIVGSYFDSGKQSSPALLLLHQWQSDRHSYDDLARSMQNIGFCVLSIDGRGFGESTKTADGKSVSAGRTPADVKAMVGDVGASFDFLVKQKNVDPSHIGIVGASYGSSLALLYAADDPKISAVALLSPGLNYFGNMPTEPAIRKYGDRPLLLVAADDDKESADSVRTLTGAAKNDKYEMKIYPAGGHGTGLFKAKVGLEGLLEDFLKKSLGK